MSKVISWVYPEKHDSWYLIREIRLSPTGVIERRTLSGHQNTHTKREMRKYLFHYRNSTGHRISMNPETDESLLTEILKAKAGEVK